MTFLRALVSLLRLAGFRRLFVARVTSQSADGVFQVALASHVLFNPEQATTPRDIAAAFATILLPYSVVGPFAGVLLDRWPRRRVLVVSQLLKAATMVAVAFLVAAGPTSPAFFLAVLLVFSVNRFILAGFSAGLPHVVAADRLVEGNSVAPTSGSVAYFLGGVVGGVIATRANDPTLVVVAALVVLAAAAAAARLPFIGPDEVRAPERVRDVVRAIALGLVEAARTLPRRARLLLALVFVTRLPLGFVLMQTLLLFRGPFAAPDERAGNVLGFGLAAGAAAAGFALAAFVTPWLAPRLTPIVYAAGALGTAGALVLAAGPWLVPWTVAATNFVVSFASQSAKISIDSLLQAHVPDQLLGRTFSVYDMMYNAGLVAAAVLAALSLPTSGYAVWPFGVIAVGYGVVALSLVPAWRRTTLLDVRRPLAGPAT